jgi:sugar phosphate permease
MNLHPHYADEDDEDKEEFFILDSQSITLPATYFSSGIISTLISNPLNVYMVQVLNVDPSIQTTIKLLETIPSSLKIVFGFTSDAFPIFGLNRKPYIIIGMAMWSFFLLIYSVLRYDNICLLAICVMISQMGLHLMDCMVETMIVVRSKLFEKPEDRGALQSTCYSLKYAGQLIGSVLGAILCNEKTWGWGLSFYRISFLLAIIPPLLILPSIYK